MLSRPEYVSKFLFIFSTTTHLILEVNQYLLVCSILLSCLYGELLHFLVNYHHMRISVSVKPLAGMCMRHPQGTIFIPAPNAGLSRPAVQTDIHVSELIHLNLHHTFIYWTLLKPKLFVKDSLRACFSTSIVALNHSNVFTVVFFFLNSLDCLVNVLSADTAACKPVWVSVHQIKTCCTIFHQQTMLYSPNIVFPSSGWYLRSFPGTIITNSNSTAPKEVNDKSSLKRENEDYIRFLCTLWLKSALAIKPSVTPFLNLLPIPLPQPTTCHS